MTLSEWAMLALTLATLATLTYALDRLTRRDVDATFRRFLSGRWWQ